MDRLINVGTRLDLKVVQALLAIMGIPREIVSEVEALAVFPGQGETWRVRETIGLWEQGIGKYLLIAGDRGEYMLSKQSLDELGLRRMRGVVFQKNAQITTDQSGWLIDVCNQLKIESVALLASPYYLLRAFMTTLRDMGKGGRKFAIVPITVRASLDWIAPESGHKMSDLVVGEIARISKYQEKGDVCSWENLQEYISWLWENFLKK